MFSCSSYHFTLLKSLRDANLGHIHFPGGYQVITKTLLCARSNARYWEHMCKVWQMEKLRFGKMSTERFSGGTETCTQPHRAAWSSCFVYTALPAHFLTQKFKAMISSLLSLSLFLSSPDLHIAKWWNYTVCNSTATLLLKTKKGME